ncbi:unnamed protein product [Diatraea saccharalis]|uniref:Uncharacterized protein n=1 Tax=Diatraea saccharalis TaxID=40085 RepID=A0A9N9WGM1_9NEOP|nr:unnamed protein product [Diatraea saccharalis]
MAVESLEGCFPGTICPRNLGFGVDVLGARKRGVEYNPPFRLHPIVKFPSVKDASAGVRGISSPNFAGRFVPIILLLARLFDVNRCVLITPFLAAVLFRISRLSWDRLRKLVSSPNVKKEDFKQTLQQAMKEKGLDTKLRNTVFHWVRTQNKQNKLDPLTSLMKASAQWEKRIHKSLNSMCSDLETSLAKIRSQSEQEELTEKWNELSTYNLDLSKYRPVYAPKDFLEVLLTLSGYVPYTREFARRFSTTIGVMSIREIMFMFVGSTLIEPDESELDVLPKALLKDEPKWEFAHLPLQVKTLDQLRAVFLEWSSGEPLLGVNANMPSSVPGFTTLEAERIGLGERVSALGYAPVIQEYLKKGSPQCLRAKLWSQVLGADITTQQLSYFNQLKKSVLDVDLMIDKLIFKDVQLTASNDDQYFVFEDLLYQVMLCFSRDYEVMQQLKGSIGNPLTVTIKGKQTSAESVTVFPPSGIIPFHGFTMYATPFCYLYDDPAQLYYTFRAFYIRYWHRLHYISTHPQDQSSVQMVNESIQWASSTGSTVAAVGRYTRVRLPGDTAAARSFHTKLQEGKHISSEHPTECRRRLSGSLHYISYTSITIGFNENIEYLAQGGHYRLNVSVYSI